MPSFFPVLSGFAGRHGVSVVDPRAAEEGLRYVVAVARREEVEEMISGVQGELLPVEVVLALVRMEIGMYTLRATGAAAVRFRVSRTRRRQRSFTVRCCSVRVSVS